MKIYARDQMNPSLSKPEPKYKTLSTSVEYEAAIDELIQKTTRELRIFDHSLNQIFGSSQRCELLRNFLLAKKNNRLFIALHSSETLYRNCPRLINLTKNFSHSVEIRETRSDAQTANDPVLIADERHYLHRFHFDYPRSLFAVDDPIGTMELIMRFEEIWAISEQVAAATTLGL